MKGAWSIWDWETECRAGGWKEDQGGWELGCVDTVESLHWITVQRIVSFGPASESIWQRTSSTPFSIPSLRTNQQQAEGRNVMAARQWRISLTEQPSTTFYDVHTREKEKEKIEKEKEGMCETDTWRWREWNKRKRKDMDRKAQTGGRQWMKKELHYIKSSSWKRGWRQGLAYLRDQTQWKKTLLSLQ